MGVNTDFSSYELKWTIDAILQHMASYPTTENPCVMMRVNDITKSCEYIIIYHDEFFYCIYYIFIENDAKSLSRPLAWLL